MKNFILSFPSIYKLLQKILVRADIYKKNLTVPENVKVLDIGCGPGTFLDILPESAEYHGFDLSETYIESAKKKYAHRNAFFKCAMVETETIGPELLGSFDVVLAIGVLHHLNDESAEHLVRLAWESLKTGGVLLTFDPCFRPKQNIIARTLAKMDRGKYVRYQDQYLALAEKVFTESVDVQLCNNVLRVPYNHIIMRLTKK